MSLIDFAEIDNTEVVEGIEVRTTGLFAMLNEECRVPKGTDMTFLEKFITTNSANTTVRRSLKHKNMFMVQVDRQRLHVCVRALN